MIFSSASRDFFYRAAQSALTYYITVDGATIYSGRVFKSPGKIELEVNVGRRISDYLESHMPDFREYDGVVVPHPLQLRTFGLWDNEGTLLEQYNVLLEWNGEWTGEDCALAEKYIRHADPRQKIFFGAASVSGMSVDIYGRVKYPEIVFDGPFRFGYESGVTTICYTANTDYTLSSYDGGWFTVTQSKGDDFYGCLTFTYEHNGLRYERGGNVCLDFINYLDQTETVCFPVVQEETQDPYYFEFLTPDYQNVGMNDTSYTITWDTNYPSITYVYSGVTGTTASSGVTVHFPANTGEDSVVYALSAYTEDNEYLGAVHLLQESMLTGKYLMIEPLESGYVALGEQEYVSNGLYYSKDSGNTWTFVQPSQFSGYDSGYTRAGATIPVNAGESVWIKGNMATCSSYDSPRYEPLRGIDFIGQFPSGGTLVQSVKFNVKGNIMSLIYGDDFQNRTDIYSGGTFAHLFKTANVVSAGGLVIPCDALTDQCCVGMFSGCKYLVQAPVLNSHNLGRRCYAGMFDGCTSLRTAPALPAKTLSPVCYARMFAYCDSLVNVSDLPATVMVEPTNYDTVRTHLGCYERMFEGCTSLVNAPAIKAATAANRCFYYMFAGCTSLKKTSGILPNELKTSSCESMFDGCTSLEAAPYIAAQVVGENSCNSMFARCSNLVSPPDLTGILTLGYGCFDGMFQFCTSLVNAPELPWASLSERCFRNMFMDCTSLTYVKCLATDTDAVQNKDATYQWLYGVPAGGTFVKASAMSWPSGVSGIPVGWTVINN